MTTEAAIAASLQRPESDLEGDSSYVPSLASPTCRDSLDEGSGIYIINKWFPWKLMCHLTTCFQQKFLIFINRFSLKFFYDFCQYKSCQLKKSKVDTRNLKRHPQFFTVWSSYKFISIFKDKKNCQITVSHSKEKILWSCISL